MVKIDDISFKAAAKFTIYTSIIGSVVATIFWYFTRPQQQAGLGEEEEFKSAV